MKRAGRREERIRAGAGDDARATWRVTQDARSLGRTARFGCSFPGGSRLTLCVSRLRVRRLATHIAMASPLRCASLLGARSVVHETQPSPTPPIDGLDCPVRLPALFGRSKEGGEAEPGQCVHAMHRGTPDRENPRSPWKISVHRVYSIEPIMRSERAGRVERADRVPSATGRPSLRLRIRPKKKGRPNGRNGIHREDGMMMDGSRVEDCRSERRRLKHRAVAKPSRCA